MNNRFAANATGRIGREGGSRFEARSQDIGWAVLVASSADAGGHFSDKEKDGASLLNGFFRGIL